MEAKVSSRKRKQPSSSSSSNPFKGIYTRSKSQIYFHHNRSGRSRSDAIRRRNHTQLFETRRTKPKSSDRKAALDDTESISLISIKDLRARRVFSPASIIEDECCFNPADDKGVKKFDSEIDYEGRNLNDVNPSLSSISEDCYVKGDIEKSDPDSSLMDNSNPNTDLIVDSSSDKHLSFGEDSTPPEVAEIGGIEGKNDAILTGSVCRSKIDRSNVSISRSKSVLSSNIRHKIFKTPSSFSYRRLLPFLTDIAKDDSCLSKIETVDIGFPCKVENSNHMNPTLSSIVDYQCAGKHNDNGAHSDDRKPSANGRIKECGFQLPFDVQNMDGMDPNLSQTEGIVELRNVEQSIHEVGETTVDLMEECDQMTPPDADIFSKPDVGDSMENKEGSILQNEDYVLGKPLNGNVGRNNGNIVENYRRDCGQRNGFISKSKLILNPCSRVKVFKTPSSVSYRRLLPFLMDIAKDNSCAAKTSQCPKHVKDMDQKPHPPILSSSSEDVYVRKSEAEGNSEKQHYTGDEEPKLPTPILTPTDGSSDETSLSLAISISTFTNVSSCNKEPDLVSTENINESHMPLDSLVESTTEIEDVITASPKKLELEPHNDIVSHGNAVKFSAISLCATVNHENLPGDFVSNALQQCSADNKKDCGVQWMDSNEDDGKLPTVSLDRNSSQIEVFDPSRINVDGIRKGILKRNPRGCRGLCNCLNCASFRLHADRAFEFSRNQMQDAEEVALELINELAYLRNILNESSVDPGVVQANQVKEACRKALKTEEIAKMRLGQMNEDLSAHCRSTCLQRPRVTFANNVEEKAIQKAGLKKK